MIQWTPILQNVPECEIDMSVKDKNSRAPFIKSSTFEMPNSKCKINLDLVLAEMTWHYGVSLYFGSDN